MGLFGFYDECMKVMMMKKMKSRWKEEDEER